MYKDLRCTCGWLSGGLDFLHGDSPNCDTTEHHVGPTNTLKQSRTSLLVNKHGW